MAETQLLSIGAFGRRSRLSPKALRLYESVGLLVPQEVDNSNGYRRYGEWQLETARLIVQLRRLEMPLAVIAQVVAAEGDEAAALVEAYWDDVERRTALLRGHAAHIRIRLSGDEGAIDMFGEVQVREVPEYTVLAQQRHILQPELVDWMGPTIGRLWDNVDKHGGPDGPLFVIFHGEVSDDSDGPVEVCLPVAAPDADAGDIPLRKEPAHQEAFVRLTKSQVDHPQILSAYEAVEKWIAANGAQGAGAPREVYFTDFMAAGPNDECVDVAFPIR
ncbi:MAG: MerR family transcriptional regulator [Mycobacteriales bacterium]